MSSWISCRAPEPTHQQRLTFLSFIGASVNKLDQLMSEFTDDMSTAMYGVEGKLDVGSPILADLLKNESRDIVRYLKGRSVLLDTLIDADGSFDLKERCKKYFEHTIAVIKNETPILTHYLISGGRSISYDDAQDNLAEIKKLENESASIQDDLHKLQVRNRISNDELLEAEKNY